MPESPYIDFRIHESRNGAAGAREEFERMVGQLVRALYGDSHPVWANPGDWGIDVVRGDLNGRVTIWQVKYFPQNVGRQQYSQIKNSLVSALDHARLEGHLVDRWILCIPGELSAQALKWWQELQARYSRSHQVELTLWDRTALEERLFRPEARHLRHRFYGGEPPPVLTPAAIPPGDEKLLVRSLSDPWEAGDELEVLDQHYIIRGDPMNHREASPADRIRACLAVPVGTSHLVWIQQAVGRGTTNQQQSLRLQAGPNSHLPRCEQFIDRDGAVTLIARYPSGSPWDLAYGEGPVTPSALSLFLSATVATGQLLLRHHSAGLDHRQVDGTVFVLGDKQVRLRDGGLMGVPGSPRDSPSPYTAPEQSAPPYSAGALTDLYQFAALVRHKLTGRPPRPGPHQPPLHLFQPQLSLALDESLNRALRPDPATRGQLADLIEICSQDAGS